MKEVYQLFCECFPEQKKTEEFFDELTVDDADIIMYKSNVDSSLVAFSLIKDDVIEAICVKPEHRNKGIGSKLLMESEEKIFSKGFNSISLGDISKQRLLAGVPHEGITLEDSNVRFFKNRGYSSEEIVFDVSVSTEKLKLDSLDYDCYFVDKNKFIEIVNQNKDNYFFEGEEYLINYPNDNYVVCVAQNTDMSKPLNVGKELKGIALYRKDDDKFIVDSFAMYDFMKNARIKDNLLNAVAIASEKEGINIVTLANVENPDGYKKRCDAKISEKYWLGQKYGNRH